MLATLAMAFVALVFSPGDSATGAPTVTDYVALGDSYSSASGVFPLASGVSPLCMQSAINYPHLVATSRGLSLNDKTCGGATVQNMTQSQYFLIPPQFNALDSSTDVVTIGIGGNDELLFATALGGCGALGILNLSSVGQPCKDAFGTYFDNLIDADAANIGAALRRIHQLAPAAKVFVVGYPAVLPERGHCYPTIPIPAGDVAYLRDILKHENSMLADQAAANGAIYVDLYTPSVGHDACKPVGVRWLEPVIPNLSDNLATVHPNAIGQEAAARTVGSAFTAQGI